MFCANCGNELRDGIKFCTKCGNKIEIAEEAESATQAPVNEAVKGKLVVYGYTQWFLVKPKIDVLMNGIKVAEVYPSAKTEIAIDRDCTITFKCMFRTAVVQAKSGTIQEIQLAFDRVTGELLAKPINGAF